MNAAHLHLVLNHFPIIIPIIGLLIMVAGFVFKSEVIKKTAFGLFILGIHYRKLNSKRFFELWNTRVLLRKK